MMQALGAFTIQPDHPSLPGHFPGRPVIPGVVLLDHVAALILDARPGYRLAGLPAVKFTRPVLPGEPVCVAWDPATAGRVAFACTVGGAEALRGAVLLEP